MGVAFRFCSLPVVCIFTASSQPPILAVCPTAVVLTFLYLALTSSVLRALLTLVNDTTGSGLIHVTAEPWEGTPTVTWGVF